MITAFAFVVSFLGSAFAISLFTSFAFGIILGLTIMYVAFPNIKGSVFSVILVAIFILSILFATMNLGSPTGLIVCITLIIVFLMMKSNIIPSF